MLIRDGERWEASIDRDRPWRLRLWFWRLFVNHRSRLSTIRRQCSLSVLLQWFCDGARCSHQQLECVCEVLVKLSFRHARRLLNRSRALRRELIQFSNEWRLTRRACHSSYEWPTIAVEQRAPDGHACNAQRKARQPPTRRRVEMRLHMQPLQQQRGDWHGSTDASWRGREQSDGRARAAYDQRHVLCAQLVAHAQSRRLVTFVANDTNRILALRQLTFLAFIIILLLVLLLNKHRPGPSGRTAKHATLTWRRLRRLYPISLNESVNSVGKRRRGSRLSWRPRRRRIKRRRCHDRGGTNVLPPTVAVPAWCAFALSSDDSSWQRCLLCKH